MAKFNAQKYWWIVIIAVAVVGIAVILITEQWLPDYQDVGGFLALGLIGAGFCWAYSIDRERLWWAIIPGLGVFTLLAAVLSDYLVGTASKNDWINVLVIGIGAVIIGAVLKRMNAKRVLMIVAMFAFLVGIAMAPFTWVLKGILIAADVLIVGFYVWRKRGTPAKSS
jgi:threonine/homoserine efflux transporter RhtA